MKKTIILAGLSAIVCFASGSVSADPGACSARPAPEWLARGVIYQVWLRAFTPEGTLKAATERLPQVAALGATIVYLPPVCLQDDDMRREFWSKRQKTCGANNPRNPYRIKDYDAIDPEYGTEADLKAFVAEAHRLGLRVLLDFVFFHCGPSCVLAQRPGFIKRDVSGALAPGPWGFPMPDFDNSAVREYFIANLTHWVKACGVDGFRGDVSDLVPLDFWEAARKRLEAVRPDIAMLGEGDEARAGNQVAAFDIDYPLAWHGALCDVLAGKKPAAELREVWQSYLKGRPRGVRFIRYVDHHDSAHGPERFEKLWGSKGVDVGLTMIFTLDGVPFLYNGQEIADSDPHSIYARMPIDWAKADAPAAQNRVALCKRLCALRKTEHALTQGGVRWLDNDRPDAVLSYLRETDKATALAVVNLTGHPVKVHVRAAGSAGFTTLLSEGCAGDAQRGFALEAHGFFVGKR